MWRINEDFADDMTFNVECDGQIGVVYFSVAPPVNHHPTLFF